VSGGVSIGRLNKNSGVDCAILGNSCEVGYMIECSSTNGTDLTVVGTENLLDYFKTTGIIALDFYDLSNLNLQGSTIGSETTITSSSMTLMAGGLPTANNFFIMPQVLKGATAIGSNVLCRRIGQHSFGNVVEAQSTVLGLSMKTVDATANVKLTLDGLAVNNQVSYAETNSLFIPSNISYAGKLTIHAKQAGSSLGAMFTSDLFILDNAGTPVLRSGGTLTTIYKDTGFLVPTVQLTGKELEILVTGIAATTITWHCKLDVSEITGK